MADSSKIAALLPPQSKLTALLHDPQFRADLITNARSALYGLLHGVTTDVAGAPSDLLSLFKYNALMGGEPADVPLGSEQLASLAEKAGILPPRENNISYKAGEFLGPIAAMGVPKAVSAAGDAIGGAIGDLASHQGPAAQFGMVGYHGTPHRFAPTETNPLGAFDLSKIGTGEGAQAYGHGIYIAEHPDVAKGYAPRDFDVEDKLMALYKNAERKQDWDSMQVLEDALIHKTPSELSKEYPQHSALISQIEKLQSNAKGSLYHVDLPDEHIANMLDWDKPLSEQAPSVQEAFKRLGMDESIFPHWTGQQAYEGEVRALSEFDGMSKGDARKRYSEQLNALGIPGIKYLDAGSRGAGEGTRNFVVFDPSILNILKRE